MQLKTNEDFLAVFNYGFLNININKEWSFLCIMTNIFQFFKKQSQKPIKYKSLKKRILINSMPVLWHTTEGFYNVDVILDAWYSLFIPIVDKHAHVKTYRIVNVFQSE